MSVRTRWVILALSTPLVAFAVLGSVMSRAAAGQSESYQHLQLFEDVMSLITNNYVEPVDMDRVLDGAMRGLADGLDADSAFLTAPEVKAIEGVRPAAAQADVGLDIMRQYYLRVVAARDGSPAAKAGLRTGDYIRAIDGKPTRMMSPVEGRTLLQGAAGSTVKLTIIRGSAAEPHEISLTRERPSTPDVTGRVAKPGVGYVRVLAFGPKVAAELSTQIADLKKRGADRVIIDLRGTTAGELTAGFEAARMFVAEGTLGSRQVRGKSEETFTARPGDGKEKVRVVLLTSAGTSGPAELFAAALKQNKRADTIGERTLGRAGLQHLVKLPDGSGLWMTYTRFAGPDGKMLHGTGVEPTVEVEEPDVDFGSSAPTADPILDKALEHLAQARAA